MKRQTHRFGVWDYLVCLHRAAPRDAARADALLRQKGLRG